MRRHCFLLAACLATGLAFAGPASAGATNSSKDDRCLRLDGRIAELRLKMRMGYSTKQGRLYRQKLTNLQIERKALCR